MAKITKELPAAIPNPITQQPVPSLGIKEYQVNQPSQKDFEEYCRLIIGTSQAEGFLNAGKCYMGVLLYGDPAMGTLLSRGPCYGDFAMGTLLWGPCYGNSAMGTLLWGPCYGDPAMGTLLWGPRYGDPAMGTLLWGPCYGASAMGTLLWGRHSKISRRQLSELPPAFEKAGGLGWNL